MLELFIKILVYDLSMQIHHVSAFALTSTALFVIPNKMTKLKIVPFS